MEIGDAGGGGCFECASLDAGGRGSDADGRGERECQRPGDHGAGGCLDLERYKATIKGLTEFGDRRQGTDRNRKAIDWIEAQLKTYGCTNTERVNTSMTGPPRERRWRRRAGERPEAVGGGGLEAIGRRRGSILIPTCSRTRDCAN